MLNKQKKSKKQSEGYTRIDEYKGITEYRLNNGLTVLYKKINGTGVVTTNITYKVGSRDEHIGETGLAHMLEHMLFKPTKKDLKRKIDSGAMQFERETGCIINATTGKDRTTYYFSYPKEYFERALSIEADRMQHVVLSDKEFQPERGNVLSEFDMYFGDPQFALALDMGSIAFFSHPYGHETIGFRQDIEAYTVDLLKAFYDKYYVPQNATLMIIGDIGQEEALRSTLKYFGAIKTKRILHERTNVLEPKQEGLRRVEVVRDAVSNVVAVGVKHEGFPSSDWFATMVLFSILTDGQDSVLHKKLVDTGLASKVESFVEPTREKNLGGIYITLSKKTSHAQVERIVLDAVRTLSVSELKKQYKKVQQHLITEELTGRESSLKIALELTEYVSADAWKAFFDTEAILKGITALDIVRTAKQLFVDTNMTIGYFIGKK